MSPRRPTSKARDTVTRDLEDTSRLHSRRDGQEIGSVECVQFDLCAEAGLGNREVQRRDEIRARPLEPVVGLDAEMYVRSPDAPPARPPPPRRQFARWRRRRRLRVSRR